MNKIKELKIDKKKYLDIAIIFACIIAITLVGTFALKLWTSTNNTELTFRIGEYSTEGITCKSGEDITVSNIGPVFDYEKDGEVITFRAVAASSNTTPLNVSFNISTITDNLKEKSFKYVLMSSINNSTFTEELKGDFSNINSGSSIDLIKDKVITKTTYYKLIIYIDGNMENPTSMQNGSLTGNVEMCIEGGDGDININSFKVDGVETTTFPLSSGYDIDTTCSDATITFDYKSQSYEISNITKNKAKCGIKYTTKTNKTYLNNYIKGLAGTTQGTGQLVNEQMDVYGYGDTSSVLSSFASSSQYTASSLSATSGTTSTDYVIGQKTVDSQIQANVTYSASEFDDNYHSFKFNVSESGKYSLTITLPLSVITKVKSESAYVYVGTSLKSEINLHTLHSGSRTQEIDLGEITSPTSQYIRVVYKAGSTSGGTVEMSNTLLPMATGGSTVPASPVHFSFVVNKYDKTVVGTESTGYRYEGKNPNNYIYFNNELWRIIGVFDSSSHGKTGEYLTKIIRNDSLGGYAWDKTGNNNWATSSLYNLLNTNYYNATDGTSSGNCYQYSTTITGNCDYTVTGIQSDYRSMVENVTWYLGGKDRPDNYTAEAFYTGERDSTSIYSGNTTSISNYIGLMYVSDYGYSVLSSSCARTTNLYYYNTSECGGSSWLKTGTPEWTITHRTSSSSHSFRLYNTASLNSYNPFYGFATRPVLYLKSNTQKINGTGTISNPYIIGS